MNTDEKPHPYPLPAESLRHFARCLVNDGQGNAYDRYRAACDAVILAVEPAVSQVRFARTLGVSRTTLRSMLRRLGLARHDGRKVVSQ